ncbi:RIP metalloprotease RseP [Oricola thermophila]|uniref:Zinc metalloprotease n=1 Tax=Oricola thermophila TaxID=2742145 RepID=A0A6N1VAX8_9HYPH|nr:RIP metalloprotease RseP [Oricola thermophila]QKV18104.1 RIP metalloprotease RseP [Oricola thermophila]
MDLVTGLFATDGFLLGTVLPFLFVLLIVVFVHELGHYLVGRWCGIGATVFSVGFGPELAGFNDRRGTRWRLSWIPLGGYVKFVGDMNAASVPNAEDDSSLSPQEREQAFQFKSVGRRAATVFAGPAANFLLAIVIFTVIFSAFGRGVADPVVSEIRPDSVAERVGFQPGDRFISLDGIPVEEFSDVQRYVSVRAGTTITMVMERDGERLTFEVTPERLEIEDRFGNKMEQGIIGVVNNNQTGGRRVERYGIGESLVMAVGETWYVVERTGGYIAGIFSGREKPDQIGGPIRVAQMSGQVATLGFVPLLNLAAILSISIGLLNLLPIPILDGGHLVFYLFEALRGKPVSERAQEYGYRIGFALILGLMVFATWNDITMLFGRS